MQRQGRSDLQLTPSLDEDVKTDQMSATLEENRDFQAGLGSLASRSPGFPLRLLSVGFRLKLIWPFLDYCQTDINRCKHVDNPHLAGRDHMVVQVCCSGLAETLGFKVFQFLEASV